MGTLLRAGTAKTDVTPPLTVPYLGYVPRHARFAAVHDPLYARALVLDDGGRRLALLAVDAIGFHHGILGPGRHFREELGVAIARRTGIASPAVMLAASHAHSTPETLDLRPLHRVPGATAWVELLIGQLAETVAAAQSAAQPARLKFGTAPAAGIAANRRQLLSDGRLCQPGLGQPEAALLRPGPVDEHAGVLLVELADGTYSAVINFACHAVSVQAQPLMSADYPGVACALVEQAAADCRHCLFTQGADGDINPRRGGNRADFADVGRYGQILGGAAVAELARLRASEVAAMEPALDCAWTTLALPIRPLPDPEPYRAAIAAARAAAAAAASAADRAAHLERSLWAEEALGAIEPGCAPMSVPVQVLRLGDLALVGCPGELFTGLGRQIREQAAAPHSLVVGYANDYAGYLSTPAAFAEGGYETSLGPWCRIAPGGGRQVVDAGLELVHGLWCGGECPQRPSEVSGTSVPRAGRPA